MRKCVHAQKIVDCFIPVFLHIIPTAGPILAICRFYECGLKSNLKQNVAQQNKTHKTQGINFINILLAAFFTNVF